MDATLVVNGRTVLGVAETRGAPGLLGAPAISVGGSRDAPERALRAAARIGVMAATMELAVVTGDARGVDRAVMRAALRAGGSVVIVPATGLAHWRAAGEYADLLTAENHIVASPFDADATWSPGRAMARNATVCALGGAHVIVYAAASGGSVAGGREALRLGRALFVVGGDVGGPGCKMLQRAGAAPASGPGLLRGVLRRALRLGGDCSTTDVVHVREGVHTIYVGRPGPWGNPYRIGRDGTREEVIERFRGHARRAIASGAMVLAPLAGQALGCSCAPAACHGHVLVELVEESGLG